MRFLHRPLLLALTLIVFALMLVTVVDVIGRYGFNAPLLGAKEITELLMALLVFAVAPLAMIKRAHITTPLFEHAIRGRLLQLRDASVGLVSALACAVLAWRLWAQGDIMVGLRGGSASLGIPVAPVMYFMAVMAALCAVIALVGILRPPMRGS